MTTTRIAKLISKNYKFLLFCVFLSLLYFVSRLISLTQIPVFVDEAIYIRWAQVMRVVSSLHFLPLSDGKQPLFMWLIIPFLKLFSDPLVAGRLVSVFSGFGTLLGVGFLSYILFKNKYISLFAVLLYVISPFCLFFDRMALADGLLSMFFLWAVSFVYLFSSKLRLDYALLAGIFGGLAWLTKSPGMLLVALTPFSAIPLFVKRYTTKSNLLILLIKYLFLLLIFTGLAFGIYNILRLGAEFHMIAIRNRDYVFTLKEVFSHPLMPILGNLKASIDWLWILLTPTTLLLACTGLVMLFRRNFTNATFLLCWLLLPLIGQSVIARVYTARYLFYLIPFLLIFAAVPLERLFSQIHSKTKVIVFLSLAFLAPVTLSTLLITNPQNAWLPASERGGYLEVWTAGFGLREVADYIKTIAPNGKVLVGTEGYFGTLPDGLQIYLEKVPNTTVIGVGWPIKQIPDQLLAARYDSRVFLVGNDSRLLLQPSPELTLLGSYPKAINPEGKQEHLLFYEIK